MQQVISCVTGGAGFIGSNLIDSLLLRHEKVICIDNLLTGSINNINRFINNPNFILLEEDVSKLKEIPYFCNYIYHLASPASVIDYQNYPEETALVNSIGTMNMLNIAKKTNAKFLFASTSEIYGDPLEHPQKETYWGNVNPVGVRSCYDESKRWGEMITTLFNKKYSTDGRIIRIFNTYGPYMRPTDGRVISNFINQAINDLPITIYGNGKQTRSFCYVTDLVEGIILVMKSENRGDIYNLGNPKEFTINELAEIIIKMTKSKSKIINKDLPKDDPVQRKPDINKAIEKINWHPKINLLKGLEHTIDYYRKLT